MPTIVLLAACAPVDDADITLHVESLTQLSTKALRERPYGATITVEQAVALTPFNSYLASYLSDDLRVYTRIDIPDSAQPDQGYPVVIFVHGWAGIERAPTYDLYFRDHDDYRKMVENYVDAGFVVLTPGWRGHGTVNEIPADGIEFMQAWDNGSYISPVFYAIDVLNLVDSLSTFAKARLDLDQINLSAHSQGGDVALITLAVAGEGSMLQNSINAASIWSGTFPSRFTQLHTYHPMESTPEAFMSGDGTWTGIATSGDGFVNPNFVFGYPSDWIETMEVAEWTWQNDNWSKPTVAEAVRFKFGQMYGAVNEFVGNIDDAEFSMTESEDGSFAVAHDPRIVDAMAQIGAFDLEEFLTEPLMLQHSDRDFYSFPAWNADLCMRVNKAGGTCHDFEYPENTHALRVSTRSWFSSENAIAGFSYALQRDIALFRGDDAADILYP